jgi:hypothetical protein
VTSEQARSTAADTLQRIARSRVVSIANLLVAPIVAFGALFGRSTPGPPLDGVFFVVAGKLGKLLFAAFLFHQSVRNLRARPHGPAPTQGQRG